MTIRAVSPLQLMQRYLVLDGLWTGVCIGVLNFSPLPTMVLISMLFTGRIGPGYGRIFYLTGLCLAVSSGLMGCLLGLAPMPALPLWASMTDLVCLLIYILGFSVVIRAQLAKLYQRNALLQRLNRIDPGIQLPNRRYFESRLDEAYAQFRRDQQTATLLLIDVDHFKQINDRAGHLIGDQVLVHVAACLLRAIRTGDLPARYGGDEFAVLLAQADQEVGRRVAERIRQVLADMVRRHHDPLVTLSIGVAQIAEHNAGRNAWVEAADMALYRAKALGRNRVEVAASLAVEKSAE